MALGSTRCLQSLFIDRVALICNPDTVAGMGSRAEPPLPASALKLLRHCYSFVNEEWQHLPRDGSTDQGFEVRLRESCVTKLVGWVVSQHREMNLGMGFLTA